MLTPEDVEQGLLSSIKNVEDLRKLSQEGVRSEHFLLYGEVLDFIVNYVQVYEGNFPNQGDIIKRFSNTDLEFEFLEAGDISYYIDELLSQYTARMMSQAVRDRFGAGGVNLRDDPYEVLAGLELDLRALQPQTAKHVAFLDRDALSRMVALEEKIAGIEKGEVGGIPTGLACFDGYYQGWHEGEGIMVVGPKGSGKSWLLMYFGCVAYRAGYKVLLVSPEMSMTECGLRFDVVLARQFRNQFSHDTLSSGKDVDMEAYRSWLYKLQERADFICVDSQSAAGFTFEDLLGLMEEYRPDLLLLDGIQLMKGREGQTGWEIIKECADGLKNAAQYYNNVVIWAGQPNTQGLTNKNEPIHDIIQVGYGKSAVEAANRLITIAEDPESKFRRIFKVPYNRAGKTWDSKQYLEWDVDSGLIAQMDFMAPQEFEQESL